MDLADATEPLSSLLGYLINAFIDLNTLYRPLQGPALVYGAASSGGSRMRHAYPEKVALHLDRR